MPRLRAILDETRDYLDRISITDPDSREAQRLVALIHASDHMLRLHQRCDEDLSRAVIAGQRVELAEVERVLDEQIDKIIDAIESRDLLQAEELSSETYRLIDEMEGPQRSIIYQRVVREEFDIRYATECVESLRWLTRASHHVSRICHYLNKAQGI